MINGRGYPDTIVDGPLAPVRVDDPELTITPLRKTSSLIEATPGQRILLRIANLSFDYYTLTALGIPMKVDREGLLGCCGVPPA